MSCDALKRRRFGDDSAPDPHAEIRLLGVFPAWEEMEWRPQTMGVCSGQ